MGGFSIQTCAQAPLRTSYPRVLGRPETRSALEPRTAQVDQVGNSEDIGALQAFLKSHEPPAGHTSRRLSAQSEKDQRLSDRRSLDVLFRSGSKSIRHLLRSRSASPKPDLALIDGRGRLKVAREPYCQLSQGHRHILQTTEALERMKTEEGPEALEKLRNSSTYRVNCYNEKTKPATAGSFAPAPVSIAPAIPEDLSQEPRASMLETRHSIPPRALTDVIQRTCQMIDGIKEEYPLTGPADSKPTSSLSNSTNEQRQPAQGTEYAANPRVRDFATRDLDPPRRAQAGSIKSNTTNSLSMINRGRSTHQPATVATKRPTEHSRSPRQTQRAALSAHPHTVPQLPPYIRETMIQTSPKAPPSTVPTNTPAADCQPRKPFHGQWPSQTSCLPFGPQPWQAALSVDGHNSQTGETLRAKSTECPNPAPTGPLPPLPEGHESTRGSHASVSSRKSPEGSSPVRVSAPPSTSTHPTHAVREQGNDTILPDVDPILQRIWNNETLPRRSGSREELFPWREQKTRQIKQRDIEKSRSRRRRRTGGGFSEVRNPEGHGEEGNGGGGGDLNGDDADTVVILPSPEPPAEDFGFLGKDNTQTDDNGATGQIAEWSVSSQRGGKTANRLSPVMTVAETVPTTPQGVKIQNHTQGQFQTQGGSTTRPTYRSHSTQCSPRRGTGRSLPVSRPSRASTPASRLLQNVQSAPFSPGTPEPLDGSDVDGRGFVLAGYVKELEARIEGRLAAHERRTMLLEAALLAVINASSGAPMARADVMNGYGATGPGNGEGLGHGFELLLGREPK